MRIYNDGIISQVQLRLPAASPGVVISAQTAVIDPDSFPLASISRPGALVAGRVIDADLFLTPSINLVTPPEVLLPDWFMGAAELFYSPQIAMSGPGYTFDSATATAVTLANNNLTATHASNANNSGVKGIAAYTVGKYYNEFTVGSTHGNSDSVGIAAPTATYTQVAGSTGPAVTVDLDSGDIGASGKTIGASTAGTVIGMAADVIGLKVWFRRGTGAWNGDALANPITGVGGIAMPTNNTWMPVVGFAGGGRQAGDNVTANFGASAYLGTQPSGFVNWPTGVMLLVPNVLDGDLFYTEIVSRTPVLVPALYVDPESYGAATIATSSTQTFAPGLFVDSDVFLAPTVTQILPHTTTRNQLFLPATTIDMLDTVIEAEAVD